MSFEGYMSDDPVIGSYLIGIVIGLGDKNPVTNYTNHTVDIQVYRLTEPLKSVPLIRSPGNVSLPSKGDIAVVLWDDREKPICIGTYPAFISDGVKDKKDYNLREGEVLLQTNSGGRLMMLNSGVLRFVNWQDQGLEIDGLSGVTILKSPSLKEDLAGVIEKSGYVRRKSNIKSAMGSVFPFELDNQEEIMRKVGVLSTPGTITSINLAGQEMYEKKIEIKVPGSQLPALPEGINIYEEIIATSVIKKDAVSGTYEEDLSSQTGLPLRKKTIFYDDTGIIELIKEEVDALGNVKIYISSLATTGINVNALIPVMANFLSLNLTTTGITNITGSQINLNGGTDFVALANLLVLAFNTHTHTGNLGSPTSPPIVPWTAPMIGSLTVKSS